MDPSVQLKTVDGPQFSHCYQTSSEQSIDWTPTDVNRFAYGANFFQDVNKSLGSRAGPTTQVCW